MNDNYELYTRVCRSYVRHVYMHMDNVNMGVYCDVNGGVNGSVNGGVN